MKSFRNIGYSEDEDTGKKTLIWQCDVCGWVWLTNTPPKCCPECKGERNESDTGVRVPE